MNRTMDAKITKLERVADRISIVPPTELIPYLQGKKAETEEENIKRMEMYDGWISRIKRALGRTSDATQHWELLQEILNGLPEPFKTGVRKALIRSAREVKS